MNRDVSDTSGPDGTRFVRPFLDRKLRDGAAERAFGRVSANEQSSSGDDASSSAVRPYFLTGGRTQTDRVIGIEALVQLSPHGERAIGSLQFERRALADVVRSPISVAEVGARIGVPLGVARVLVADMVAESLVVLHEASTRMQNDIALITRLIHGVRAL